MTGRREFVGAMLAIFCGVALPLPARDAIEIIRLGPEGSWIRAENGVFWTLGITLNQAALDEEVLCLKPSAPIPVGAPLPIMEGATEFSMTRSGFVWKV